VINSKFERNAQKSNKAARTIGLLITSYSTLSLPYVINNVKNVSLVWGKFLSSSPETTFDVPNYCTSAMNPIIINI